MTTYGEAKTRLSDECDVLKRTIKKEAPILWWLVHLYSLWLLRTGRTPFST